LTALLQLTCLRQDLQKQHPLLLVLLLLLPTCLTQDLQKQHPSLKLPACCLVQSSQQPPVQPGV
jgi:hypothetical protein